MRISIKKTGFLFCCMWGILGASARGASSIDQAVGDLVASPPAQTFGEEQQRCASLLELGPDAVKSLCHTLGKNGVDARQRTVLQSLAMAVGKDGAEKERLLFVQAVSESLQSGTDKEIQTFLIELLQWAGKDESVKTLSRFLADLQLSVPAVRALTVIGTPQAIEALSASLDHEQTADKVAVVLALGTLRATQAAEKIMRYADSSDLTLRQSAHFALANIGDASAAKQIESECARTQGYAAGVARSHYLLLASRLAEQGQRDQSAVMCRKLLADSTPPVPAHIQAGALETLVAAIGEAAMDDLLAAAGSDNDQVQAAATAMANRIPGPQATQRWIEKISDASPRLKTRIAVMLGRRGDAAALPAIVALFKHPDDTVAAAAIAAAVQLDQDKAAAAILEMLQQTDQPERIAAGVDVLMGLPGEKAMQAAAQSLPGMPAASRIKLMKGLANRRAAQYSRSIMAQTADADASVRQAAIGAMAFCASAEDFSPLLAMMLQTQDAAERLAVQRAVVAAALRNPDSEKRTDRILEIFPEAVGPNRVILLRTLGQLGGSKSLQTVVGLIKDADPDVRDAAIRALADWPDASAVPGLMSIVKTEALQYQVIALRSALKLMQGSEIPDNTKEEMARQAMGAVTRIEEKRLILSFAGQIRTLGALALTGEYLADDQLKTEAAVSAARIALPAEDGGKSLGGDIAVRVLTLSLEALQDEALRQKVQSYLKMLPVQRAAPEGFTQLFNGKDTSGWQGVLLPPCDNPVQRAQLGREERAALQAKADEHQRTHWSVQDGVLLFDGKGFSLSTVEDYKDFELYVDWKIDSHGDSGIYLRGSPQVQIWDPADWPEGSGGLYNNQKNPSKPLVRADNPIGQWNTFHIKMIDHLVTVYLNGILVVDQVTMENYWDRSQPIFPTGPIELQCHGNPVWFNNIFIRRITPEENDEVSLFNGTDLSGWTGDTAGYVVEEGAIVCRGGGNVYTEKEYSDFHFKCQFRLAPGANSGVGIRTPLEGDAAYQGMEIQVLDDGDAQYANLKPYQYDGSIYGVVPAKRGHLKPVGQWNTKEIIAKGRRITVILNGVTIVDADLTEAIENGAMDGGNHPGLKNVSGHIGFLGHGLAVAFRDITIKEL